MFGTFRLVLALMVVWYHFVDNAAAGRIAVFGFFCLSGYLMTRVVNTTYADGLGGFVRYLGNRALRIYPAYWAVLALIAGIVALWPVAAERLPAGAFLPEHRLANIFIVGLGLAPFRPAINATAWSLNIELLHYIAIGALLGRSRLACVLWFALALEVPLLLLSWLWAGVHPSLFYFHPLAASIAFAAGAMIWHFDAWLPRGSLRSGAFLAALLIILSLTMSREASYAGGLHAGLALAAGVIVCLRHVPAPDLDRRLGDFSYPVFLVHFPALHMIAAVAGSDGPAVKMLALAVTVALSWLIVALVDRPIERIRSALRGVPRTAPRPA